MTPKPLGLQDHPDRTLLSSVEFPRTPTMSVRTTPPDLGRAGTAQGWSP